jgi:hypothetical protein
MATLPPGRIGMLLASFDHEMANRAPGFFLASLEESLYQGMAHGESLEDWQDVISAFRRRLLPALHGDEGALRQAENLCQQARVLIASIQEQQLAKQQAIKRQEEILLHQVSRSLIATFDVAGLMNILAGELPRLGIASCYLSLYENPAQPTGFSRLVLAYNDQGRAILPPEGRRFHSMQLVPDDLLPSDRQWVLLVEPLYFGDERLGFILFEVGPQEGTIYSVLRGQIGSALKGAHAHQPDRGYRPNAKRPGKRAA